MGTKISSLVQEFKEFAFKGNLIDLAVAVVIGAAFGKVIDAIVKDVIMPLVGYIFAFAHLPKSYESWKLGESTIGHLLAELVNFLIVALAVFLVIVKVVGGMVKKMASRPVAPSEPTTRECPMCLSIIPIKAKKCAHCASEVAAADQALALSAS